MELNTSPTFYNLAITFVFLERSLKGYCSWSNIEKLLPPIHGKVLCGNLAY